MENKNNFIPYGRQSITDDDIQEVVKVLESPLITQGTMVPAFEKFIADKVSASFGVAVNSATSALHISCLVLGLSKNDYLWTSPITFVSSANCARFCGAKVDFVDVDKETGLMSINSLKVKLKEAEDKGKLPKILIPVHLAGASCDMEEISKLSKRYGFKIIEDASHAIGGSYKEYHVGSCKFSDVCIFSFHPVKIITTGEGGLITTNSEFLYKKLKSLRSHGIEKDSEKFEFHTNKPWIYEMQELGFNYRMNDFQAALGLSQLYRLSSIIEKRNYIYEYYKKRLIGLPLKLLKIPNNVKSSVHLCVVQLTNSFKKEHLNLFNFLRSENIGVQVHYTPVHLQPYYKKLGFKEGDFKISEDYAKKSISLPVFETLSNKDLEKIIDLLNSYFQKKI